MRHGPQGDGAMHRVEKPRGITRDYISGIRLRSLASEIRTYATVPVLKGPDVTRHKGGKRCRWCASRRWETGTGQREEGRSGEAQHARKTGPRSSRPRPGEAETLPWRARLTPVGLYAPGFRRGHRACSPGHPVTIPHARKKHARKKDEDGGQPAAEFFRV